MQTDFEILGYSVDLYYQGKFYGSYKIEQPDRDILGYSGRKQETLTEDWAYKNKKLKKGTVVYTECYPICGRMIGTLEEKIKRLAESKLPFGR